MTPLRLVAAAVLVPALGLPGCGVLALSHDQILGPISPAGRIHALSTGGDFRIGDEGPTADPTGAHPFRVIPLDPIRRLFEVPRTLMQGLVFYAGFLGRFVFEREAVVGRPLEPEQVSALAEGRRRGDMTVEEVLDLLGAPRLWIKRREGSVMLYAADASEELALNLGVPPGIGSLIPIPGVGEILRFDYSTTEIDRHRTILFFGPDGRLRSAVSRTRTED